MLDPQRTRNPADADLSAGLRLVEQLQQALQRQDRAAIVDALGQLVALRAPMGGQWQSLAYLAAQNGEIALARDAFDLFIDSTGGNPVARYEKAGLLVYTGAVEEALATVRAQPPEVPDPFSHALSRGGMSLTLGETGEARHWLEQATRLRPRSGSAWHTLSKQVDFAADDDLFERLVAAEAAMEGASASEFALYSYALGKALADRGDPARAFAAVARGAEEMKGPYDRELDRRGAEEAVAGYDAGRIAALAARQSQPTDRTIFVMGLPRSGTTLVEQILASHSEVADGGEIDRLALLAQEIGGTSYAALESYVARTGTAAAAQLWHHWLAERFPAPGRVVDKTNHNGFMLGLAASLLPQAPLIWLQRDPLDCAWSCFRTGFLGTVPWSHDLEDIAFHFRLEDELLARWREILGARLLVVPYEQLVSEPEPWIRCILAHCGLPEEPQVFSPHETRRAVATSSSLQVRRPINRAGIGSAEPYRAFLQPFSDAYFR